EAMAEVLEALLEVGLGTALAGRSARRRRRLGDRVGPRGHSLDLELVDALRLVEALQMPLAEREHRDAVRQARAHEGARRLRDEHVAAATDGADPGGANHIETVVPL